MIGNIPYRLALAGGWIDQPFLSRLNPNPPGSMVVVSLEPNQWFLERAGMATGTRAVARKIWNDELPDGHPDQLVRELYYAENEGKVDRSGSQDMIGIIHPGVSRLDYDPSVEDGYFPSHIESTRSPEICQWIERVVHLIPINQRPTGYNPLEQKVLDGSWIARLGRSGRDCFESILRCNLTGLGESMNECMKCWAHLLPNVLEHSTLHLDLRGILAYYQSRYPGAMYSGCGGGYVIALSDELIPESIQVKVRY